MRPAVYNPAIPRIAIQKDILNTVNRASVLAFRLPVALCFFLLTPGLVPCANAQDWSVPEQQLARKIVAVTEIGKAHV